jgi:hypothetical protein
MVYRKGELSLAGIDRGWPHQVALPATTALNGGHKAIQEFCVALSLCNRGHSVFHEYLWWNVYCFADPIDAEKFMRQFGGEKFDPGQREATGRGGKDDSNHQVRANKKNPGFCPRG